MTGHCASVVFLVLFVAILLMGRTSVGCVLSTFTFFVRQIPIPVLRRASVNFRSALVVMVHRQRIVVL